MELSEVIRRLTDIEKYNKHKGEVAVVFDFGYLKPNKFMSWRGSYDQLAIDWREGGGNVKLSEFLKDCKEVVGKTFTGYKGGEFMMSESNIIYVAEYSQASCTQIVDIEDLGWTVMLHTKNIEY